MKKIVELDDGSKNVGPLLSFGKNFEEDFYEYANLHSDVTGIEGTIYITSKRTNSEPYISYVLGTGDNRPEMSFLISKTPSVLGLTSYSPLMKENLTKIKHFIQINHKALLWFWNNGEGMELEDILRFYQSKIKKV